MASNREEGGTVTRARGAWRWLLVDASRPLVVAVLAIGVFTTTLLVGMFGPVSVQAFLLEGTSTAEAYIEIQPAIITITTIVLAINQLVLSPEIGPIGTQRQRLEDTIDHRTNVENEAGMSSSPTEPARFLATIVDATRKRATAVAEAFDDGADPEARRRIGDLTDRIIDESRRLGDSLDDRQFGQIELLGAAMHFDSTKGISRTRALRNEHSGSLSAKQENAMNDLINALKLLTTSREYFRMLYVRSEFIRFSRALLYSALPAFLVAHYSVQIIGPNALTGTTLGVPHLLWYECCAITVTSLPLLIFVGYVGRLVTLAETSIFIGPFLPR